MCGLQEPGKSSGDHWWDLFQEAFPATAGFTYSGIQIPYVFISYALSHCFWWGEILTRNLQPPGAFIAPLV